MSEQKVQTAAAAPASYLEDAGVPQWYVIHTYSGLEDNVKRNLMQRIESLGMERFIFEVLIPTETKIKIKNGKRKNVVERVYPGYVFVNMVMTDASWYVVRNTPNVTGFAGTGNYPSPVAPEDIKVLQQRMGTEGEETSSFSLDAGVGDVVKVTDGPFKDYEGKVSHIDDARGKVKVMVSLFGRETPLELDFLQVKKI